MLRLLRRLLTGVEEHQAAWRVLDAQGWQQPTQAFGVLPPLPGGPDDPGRPSPGPADPGDEDSVDEPAPVAVFQVPAVAGFGGATESVAPEAVPAQPAWAQDTQPMQVADPLLWEIDTAKVPPWMSAMHPDPSVFHQNYWLVLNGGRPVDDFPTVAGLAGAQ